MHRLVFFLLLIIPSFSQSLAIGVKGGIRATNDVEGSGTSESKLYLVGPAVEVKLRVVEGLAASFTVIESE